MRSRVSSPIDASVDAAWPLLADLSKLAEWSPDVASSPADPLTVGAVRRARLVEPSFGKDELVERIVEVGDRRFTYDIESGIGPLKEVRTTWALEEDGPDSSIVVVESDVALAWYLRLLAPVVKRQWDDQLQALAHGFAAYASEHGSD